MAEAEPTTIARPYARAVFDLALDAEAGLAAWSGALSILAALVREARLETLLADPMRSPAQRADALLTVAGDELTEAAGQLVRVLAQHDRLLALPRISELFEAMKAEHERILDVEVVTAYDLSAEEREQLTRALARHLQREIRLASRTDDSLLGGVLVRTENLVADHSLRGKLAKLARTMNG